MEFLTLLLALPAWVLCIIVGAILMLIAYLGDSTPAEGVTEAGFFLGMVSIGLGVLVAVVKLFIWMVME